ncbi:MAG: sodium:calcium antiporter [Ignavibacteria bacterium]|nr:sodium:calcium antiporter [Ignavibacteria bacterium]
MNSYLGFLICAAVILFAGKKLSYYGDAIAKLTGLGRAWIGLVFMAAVTSLPELMVGISSSALIQSADLAAGDIFGSCAFNLGILALMDAFIKNRRPIFTEASQSHILSAALGIILVSMAGVGLFLPFDVYITPSIGLTSILFIIIYFFSIRVIYLHEKKSAGRDEKNKSSYSFTLKKAITMYVVFAVVIISAALTIPYFAEEVAYQSGLGNTFVGTLFLAASTSLPEVAVSLSAVRMGSVDLSVGNLLGSNIFNILILAIDDIFYTKGHLLKDASESNLISVICVVIMSAIAITGLTYRLESKRFLLALDAFLIFIVYALNIILLYYLAVPV